MQLLHNSRQGRWFFKPELGDAYCEGRGERETGAKQVASAFFRAMLILALWFHNATQEQDRPSVVVANQKQKRKSPTAKKVGSMTISG